MKKGELQTRPNAGTTKSVTVERELPDGGLRVSLVDVWLDDRDPHEIVGEQVYLVGWCDGAVFAHLQAPTEAPMAQLPATAAALVGPWLDKRYMHIEALVSAVRLDDDLTVEIYLYGALPLGRNLTDGSATPIREQVTSNG